MQKSNFLFFGFFLCLFSNLYSQNIIFTDPNFKQALLNHTPVINTDGNNEISYDEAKVITRLDLDNKNISNLDGIQYFINLDILNCSNNSITKIDASHTSTLTKLRFITARYNNIHTVDVRTCPLWGLRLDGNNIKYAYLTGPSTFLVEASSGIYFELDQVEYVCISQAQYDTQDNNVSHQGFWDNIGSALHIGQCTIVPPPICQIINFPDPNFKQALLNHTPVIDTDGDGEICIDEAEAAGSIKANNRNIENIIGIEYFINLESLELIFNQLTSIDISNNKKIKDLRLQHNNLTQLNLDSNKNLESLQVGNNKLEVLNFIDHSRLKYVTAGNNQLTNVTVTNSPVLWNLQLHNNLLTNIDIESAVALINLTLSSNQLSEVDISKNTILKGLNLNNNPLQILDISNNSKLFTISVEYTNIESIDITNCEMVTKLDIGNNSSLKEAFLTGNHKFYESFEVFTNTEFDTRNIHLRNAPNLQFVCVNNVMFFNEIRTYIQNTLGYLSCTVSTNCDSANMIAFSDYFLLSPNPGVTYMNLTKKDPLIKSKIATILTLTGQVVKTVNLSFQSNGRFSTPSFDSGLSTSDGIPLESAYLDISDIIPGSYILTVSSNLGTLTTQFIKQ